MEFLNQPVTKIMSSPLVSVEPTQRLLDVKHIFEKRAFHHHIPVTENGSLKGMISLVDFLFALKNASLDDRDTVYYSIKVADVMRSEPVYVPSTATVRQVAEILSHGEIHAVVVVENDKAIGIVSTSDLIKQVLKVES